MVFSFYFTEDDNVVVTTAGSSNAVEEAEEEAEEEGGAELSMKSFRSPLFLLPTLGEDSQLDFPAVERCVLKSSII